jgi:hypothetical protein
MQKIGLKVLSSETNNGQIYAKKYTVYLFWDGVLGICIFLRDSLLDSARQILFAS